MTIALNVGTAADINDYSSLIEKIRLWLDRDDLDTLIPTFILLTESYLNRILRVPDMETEAILTLTNGAAQMPEDFLELRYVQDVLRKTGLRAVAPGPFEVDNAYPRDRYSLHGNRFLASSELLSVEIGYWQRIPALSEGVTVNWLLAKHPDIYLFGALAQAGGYIDDPRQASQWAGVFASLVEDLQRAGNKARYGGTIIARHYNQVRGTRA